MFLFDTNVFLEILLGQEKMELCQQFLNEKKGNIYISDFSLHSIGVILFRYKKSEIFQSFIDDVLDKIKIVTLSKNNYNFIPDVNKKHNLDFDDSYQYMIAKENGFTLVTLDTDFKKIQGEIDILFL